MRPLSVSLPEGRSYSIHFGSIAEVPGLMAGAGMEPGRCLIVTDSNVGPRFLGDLTGALTAAGWSPRGRVLPAGEATKNLEALGSIYDWALAAREGPLPSRATPVIALGGGMIGDVAGFAAATLLRGLPLVQIPTSLLAQVDSSVGGKTAINHPAGKNLIGAFHQPRLVVVDADVLDSLPSREWHSGLAEVVKAALLEGGELLDLLDERWEDVLARDRALTGDIVRRAIGIKARIVEEDEREDGARAVLNLGHTFAHAIEAAVGFGALTHGEAVVLGLRAALHLSFSMYPDLEWRRADALVARIPVPAHRLPSTEALSKAVRLDKKRSGGEVRYVLLERLGRPVVRADVPSEMVDRAWGFARGAALRDQR